MLPIKFPISRKELKDKHFNQQQDTQLAFWEQCLAGELPVMEWPINKIEPTLQESVRGRYNFIISNDLKERIYLYTKSKNTNPSVFLLATFRILLYRYSRQKDIIIGNLNNETSQEENRTSNGSSALPLRIKIDGNQSFQKVLEETQQVASEAYANKEIDFSFDTLNTTFNTEKNTSRASIFQILFHWINLTLYSSEKDADIFKDIEAKVIPAHDLKLEVSEQYGILLCTFDYTKNVFNEATIEQMAGHLKSLLEAVVENAGQPIALLPILTPDEQNQLLNKFNQPALNYTPECIHYLFEQQVSRSPDAIALIFNEKQLTYKELNSKANQLAHYLQKFGIGPEVIVGLCMKRSTELLIGILGILKAGGAFMPLDPKLPADRLSFMLEDAKPALVLTQEGLPDLPVITVQTPLIYVDRDWPFIAQESSSNIEQKVVAYNLMYVIYTSGSSGQPKGVLIEHASLTSFLKAYNQVIELNDQDRVLQFVPVVFDPMVEDIFCTFYHGSTLILRTEEMADSVEIFLEKCKEWRVTSLNLPAAFWHLLAEELTKSDDLQLPSCIRLIKVGGERLLPEKVHAWKNRFGNFPRLLNAYGPTETTIAATMYDCIDFAPKSSEVPIGSRLNNVQLYVVDDYLQPVPVGVLGELWIGGEALARGYLNRPELNDQKFIADPFSGKHGTRIYRTGDLVCRLPDGKLEYHGRIDNQVKIRGFRVELGEIESLLAQHHMVKQAAVVVREDVAGEKRIIAYIVPESGVVETAMLRTYLLGRLPDYMIPANFVALERLPLTFNGKIDRNALPVPIWPDQQINNTLPALTQEEELLTRIWVQLFHLKEISTQDNFFEIGGHSLLAIKLIAEIKRSINLKLPLSWIFAHPTINEQAKYLQMTPNPDLWDTLICIQAGGTKTPLYLIHDGKGGVEYGFQLAHFMDKDYPIYGFQAVGLNGIDEPLQSVEAMADYYIQRLLMHQPEGPYHLGAYSGGAAIAYEMACRLKARGKMVGMVAIFDAYPVNLNRFTYQRIGLYYVLRSIGNLILSSNIPAQHKLKMIINEIPDIIKLNWTRIKLKAREQKTDTIDNPSMKILRVLKKAVDTYRIRNYHGSILFVRAIENPAKYLRNSDFGWGRYAKEVKVYDLPGNHHMVFRNKENAQAVSIIVEKYLADYEIKTTEKDIV